MTDLERCPTCTTAWIARGIAACSRCRATQPTSTQVEGHGGPAATVALRGAAGPYLTDSKEQHPMDSNTRRHPIGRILSEAALGQPPDPADIDQLDLPADKRRALTDAARHALALKAEGSNADADKHAHEHAANLIASLPEDRQDAAFYDPPPPPDPTDPAALAALVARW